MKSYETLSKSNEILLKPYDFIFNVGPGSQKHMNSYGIWAKAPKDQRDSYGIWSHAYTSRKLYKHPHEPFLQHQHRLEFRGAFGFGQGALKAGS